MKKVTIEIVTMDLYDNKVITKKEIEYVPGTEIKTYLVYTDNSTIELNNNLVTIESLIKEFGEIFEVVNSDDEVITVKNHPDFSNDWRSISTRTILNYDGINRIAGESKNEYYYGLKVQNIKVNDIICVTSGMITSRVLEFKTTAKGVTLVLDNNRNRNFKNDTIVIVANQGLKEVNRNIIECINDFAISLMFDDILLNNNFDKYQNTLKKDTIRNKIELYRKHLEVLGLINTRIESEEIANDICNDVLMKEDLLVKPNITHTTDNLNNAITHKTIQTITNQDSSTIKIQIQTNNLNDGAMIYLTTISKTGRTGQYNSNSCNIPKKYNKIIQELKEVHYKHFDTETIHKNISIKLKQTKLIKLESEIKETDISKLSYKEMLGLSTKVKILANLKRDLNLLYTNINNKRKTEIKNNCY